MVDAVEAALAEMPAAVGPITLVECASMPLAIELAEAFAPEHLEIATRDPEAVASKITRSGAVFVGPNCATAFGDYVAGSNHVLPTGGAARYASALGPTTFLRRMSVVEMTDEAVAGAHAPPGRARRRRGLPHAPALRRGPGERLVSRAAEARRATGETDVRARVEPGRLRHGGRVDRRRASSTTC